MIMAAAMLLNQVLLHWTQSITQRFGRREWLASRRFDNTFATRWPFLAGGVAIAMLALTFTPLDWPKRFYGLENQMHWFILPAMLTLWMMAEAQSLQQVRERFAVLAWSPLLSDFLLLGAIVTLMAIAAHYGAPSRDTQFIFLYVISLCVWLLWLANELRGYHFRWQWPRRSDLTGAVLFAAPLVPGFLIGYMAEWGDYFLIRHFYSGGEVGIFHPAYQYFLIMVGLPTALASVLLPRIVAAHDHDGGIALGRLVQRHAPQFTLLWSLTVLPVAALLPALFGWLLGAQYSASTAVLQILLLAVPGAVVLHVYGVAYFVQGRLGISTLGFFGVKSAVNLSLSFLLLPAMGVTGSAIGSVSSYLLLQWLFVLDQHRRLRLEAGSGVRALALAQGAGLLLAMVSGIWERLAVATISAVLMLAWARRSSLFSPDEVSAIIPARFYQFEKPLQRLFCSAAS